MPTTAPTRPSASTQDRAVRCRYLRRSGEQCTGEAADPAADVVLCLKHMARVLEHARATFARYKKESS